MTSPRALIFSAAFLALAVLAVMTMWPRGNEVTVWTEADLERKTTDGDGDPSELNVPRAEVEPPRQTAAEPGDEVGDRARTLTLRGRIVDQRAVAVAGASVQLELRGAERERVRKPVTTASDGSFAFRGPLRGVRTVSVLAAHPDFAPTLVDREVPAALADDELQLGDIPLGRGARVSGVVVRADGGTVAGATVELSPESGNRVLSSRDGKQLMPVQTTDNNGGFAFARVPPGAYRAVARATRMVANSSESITLGDGEQGQLAPIKLQPGTLLVGLVTDRRGRPVEKAQVSIAHLATPGPQQRATTGADGRFGIDHLRRMLSDVRVTAAGFVAYKARLDLAAQQDVTITLDDGLRLVGRVRDAATGQPITAFAVQARRLRSPQPPVATNLAGISREELMRQLAEVTRSQQEQPDDAAVLARLGELQNALQAHNNPLPSPRAPSWPQDPGAIESHPDGAFVLTGLDEGVYAVDVKANDFLLTRSEAVEVRLGAEAPALTIDLQRGLSVRGHVVRASDGQGIGKARVELVAVRADAGAGSGDAWRERGPTLASAISGDDGAFTLRNVRPGRGATHAFARGFDTAIGAPMLLQADVDGVRIELAARAALHGHVRGVPDGREGEVTVIAMATHRNVSSRPLGDDATYRLEELAPGSYHVRAYLADSRTAVRRLSSSLQTTAPPTPNVTLAAGEERSFDLDLTPVPLGSLRGLVRVNGAAGSGYQAQLVGTTPSNGDGRSWGMTQSQQIEPDGGFFFRAVEPASYELRVHSIARDRVELARQRVQVREGEEGNVVVEVVTASLAGEVTAPEDGKPVDGSVRLRPLGAPAADEPSERPADSRDITLRVRGGRFHADDLPAGSFTLEVRAGNDREIVAFPLELAGSEQKTLTLTAGAKKKADERR